MNQELLEYLQRQISLGKERLNRYVVNPSGKAYPKRNIYIKTEEYISAFLKGNHEQKRWVIIPGLRGLGKTTILAQSYVELLKYGDKINLLYVSLDEVTDTLGGTLMELLSEYERLIGESYETLSKPTFLLLDEVQSDPKWAPVLKSLNDRTKNLFLLCSGSSALHLQDTADIAGRRAVIEKLYPLNFCEFEMVRYETYPDKGLKNVLKQALYGSRTAAECFELLKAQELRVNQYWAKIDRQHWPYYLAAGTLPFALAEKKLQNVYEAVLASVDKVVTKDIQQLGRFSSDTIPVIKRLLYILAESDAISNIKLAEVLRISHLTVASILEVLAQAELLIRIPPFGSQIGATKKPSKYLFMSPSIRAAFFNIAGTAGTTQTREGKLLEDLVGLHFYREFESTGRGAVNYDPTEGGADFILKLGQEQIVIEIGRGQKSGRQVATTMKRVSAKYGLVVSREPLALIAGGDTVVVPQDMFALV